MQPDEVPDDAHVQISEQIDIALMRQAEVGTPDSFSIELNAKLSCALTDQQLQPATR